MAKSHHRHPTVKELKQDEFVEHLGEAYVFYKKHRNAIWNTVLAVVAVVLVVQIVRGQRIRAQQEAESRLAQGLALIGDPTAPADPSNYQEAYALFEETARKYGKTLAGRTAAVFLGDVNYRQGAYDDAIAAYRSFLQDNPDDELAPRAHMGIAYSLEAKGDIEGAMAELRTVLEKFPDSFLADEAALDLARVQEEAGDLDGARKTLEELLAGDPPDEYKRAAQQRLTFLGTIPPPPKNLSAAEETKATAPEAKTETTPAEPAQAAAGKPAQESPTPPAEKTAAPAGQEPADKTQTAPPPPPAEAGQAQPPAAPNAPEGK